MTKTHSFRTFPRAFRKATRSRAGRSLLGVLLVLAFAAALVSAVVKARVVQPRDVATEKSGEAKAEFVPGEILVRFRAGSAPDVEVPSASMELADGRTVSVGFKRFGGSDLVEGLRLARVPAEATLDAVAALNKRADVLYAAPNYIRRKTATTPNDPSYPNMYALQNTGQSSGTPDADIDADEAWDTTRGSSTVVVGIIDEGFDISHPDLTDNVWRNPGETPANGIDDDANGLIDDVNGWDFVHDDASVFDSADGDDHGTHVAGTVGARGNNATGVVGVNWEVSLMSLKVLGSTGGKDSDIIDAYRYAKQMRQRGVNLRVLNNSYGGPGYQPAAADAIRELGEVGILFVAAAGNKSQDNFKSPHYPSDYDLANIISVAATTRFDNLASFSNFGPRKVTMGAPGQSILSTTPNNTYSTYSGTSMASPHVAGVAALTVAANPSLTLQQLYGAVVYGGDANNILLNMTRTGRRLNARGALQSALEGDATPPAPASNLRVTAQDGRSITLAWNAPGDDGTSGTAVDYDLYFVNPATGLRLLLPSALLPAAGSAEQSVTVALPYRNFSGEVELRTYDNAGNFGAASVPVTVGDNPGSNPYDMTTGGAESLSTGGTPLNLIGDDRYQFNHALPFNFPFFGAFRSNVTISTNGTLYFSQPPMRNDATENADDPRGTISGLQGQTMIAGMWEDLRTDRNGGDIFVVQPDANTIIFRWQGATFDSRLSNGTTRGELPINFEIELRSNGTIKMRYGAGQSAPINTRLAPVVGISPGEPQPYVAESHTSESALINLTNAQTVTFTPRSVPTPTPVNNRPVANAQSATASEDSPKAITLAGSDTETSTDQLSFNITVQPTHGTLTGTGATRTYTPAENYNGPDSFNFTVTDTGNGSAAPQTSTEATVSITVAAVNDAPTASGQAVATNEDSAKAITLSASDVDGGSLTYNIVTQPAHGTLSGTGANLTYTPNPNYHGADLFTFKANDGAVDSNTATVSVTINSINDPPTANDNSLVVAEDSGPNNVAVLTNDSDPEGDTLNVTAVTQGEHGSAVITGGGTGVNYAPDQNYFGADSFTYTVSDGKGGVATATVNVTVTAVNDAPVAVNDTATANEGTPLVKDAPGVLSNDTDVDNASLTAIKVSGPANGTLILNGDGSYTYTPNTSFNGTDSFTYKASDGIADSNVVVVVITVTAAPSPTPTPTPTPAQTFSITGRVADAAGNGVGAIRIAVDGPTLPNGTLHSGAVTDANGNYALSGLTAGATWTVRPDDLRYDFVQPSPVFTNLSANQVANFTAVRATAPVLGRVIDDSLGVGGVTVTATHQGTGQLTTITNSNGDYQFANLLTGESYTLTPSKTGFSFSPTSIVVVPNRGSQPLVVFVATQGERIDSSRFFVRQHYLDFFGREPDAEGAAFWTGNIEACGADASCREVKRIDTSAAFFLSIEFQQTGYLVYRAYMASYGNIAGKPVPLTFQEFLAGMQVVGQGVVVGQGNWQTQIEANRVTYFNQFVQTDRFKSKYPETLSADSYASALYATAGIALSGEDLEFARAAFNTSPLTARAVVLRRLTENQSLSQREYNRAFVLMQYFGYLRRDPDSGPNTDFSGYNFWLNKLNQFGDYRQAEMVKAFITSGEYRGRF